MGLGSSDSSSSDDNININSSSNNNLNNPLLLSESHSPKRTGTLLTAVAHIVTGVIGSGVLSLPWSIAQLGWIVGPFSILLIASSTLFSAFLLCNTYRSPNPEYGPHRSASYLDVVNFNLGVGNGRLCGILVNICIYGFGIAFVITASISLRAIQNSISPPDKENEATSEFADAFYMLLFGILQIVLAQIPNLHDLNWLSVVAAMTSFAYCFIGMGLSILQIVENGYAKGRIEGIVTSTGTQKLWLVSQALGDVSFSYPFSTIMMEIQDTLKTPPPENQTMKKASTISVSITTFFYICCGCAGYAAFGDNTPGNLLTGFGSSRFQWLVNFANACIVIHLIGSYQVYCQPLFGNAESWLRFRFPDSEFVNRTYTLKLPLLPAFELSFLCLSFRTAYVASTVLIAVIFPYFNQILGLLGSVSFWPLTIYFPVEVYLSRSNTDSWTPKWIMLQTFNISGLVFGLFTLVGCIRGIVTERLA